MVVVVALAALALGLTVVGRSVTRGPHFVDLTIVNPTPYDLDVDATDGNSQGWTGIGTAGRQSTTPFDGVIDQGGTWVLRFTYGGQTAGELRFSRHQLATAGWRINIPAAFSQPFEEAHIAPPPG